MASQKEERIPHPASGRGHDWMYAWQRGEHLGGFDPRYHKVGSPVSTPEERRQVEHESLHQLDRSG